MTSRRQFDAYLKSIMTELVRVNDFWKLFSNLSAATEAFGTEFRKTPYFWNHVLRAFQDVIIVRIAASVDRRNDVASMPGLLRTIKENVGNPQSAVGIYVEHFDLASINIDEESISSDQTVKKLQHMRHKLIAHRDTEIIITNRVGKAEEISADELGRLLEKLYNLARKYCSLFDVPPLARYTVGEDDYKRVLKLIKQGLQDEADRTSVLR